jgi:hypothetical protein
MLDEESDARRGAGTPCPDRARWVVGSGVQRSFAGRGMWPLTCIFTGFKIATRNLPNWPLMRIVSTLPPLEAGLSTLQGPRLREGGYGTTPGYVSE